MVHKTSNESEDQFPSWVYSPYDFCSESSELCATGEGPNFSTSDQEARSNLASIFKVHVSSSLQSSITEENSLHQMEMKVRAEATRSLQTSVDEVLESVQIKKRFQKDGVFYSLAKLDRHAATAILNNRIDKIDQELLSYWNRKQRTLVRKMLRLSLERSSIEEKLAILTPVFRPAPISYQQILDWSLSFKNKVPVSLKVGHAPKWLTSKLSSLLNEVGYKIEKGEAKNLVSVNVTSIKEYLNVSGFEKYTFTMNIQNIQKGQKVGHLTKSETVVGRNQEDALLKIKNSFVEYLEDQLYTLNLD
ncbi:MAG: LPP20 family lipoprotein [Candidatus Caldatribacteriota bacterium]